MIDGWGASPPETRWLARNRSFRAKDGRAHGEAPEPLVDLLRVEAEQVAELQVRDPTLCDETTDVPHADVQACSHPVDVEKRLDIGARRAQAKCHARTVRFRCLVSGLVSCRVPFLVGKVFWASGCLVSGIGSPGPFGRAVWLSGSNQQDPLILDGLPGCSRRRRDGRRQVDRGGAGGGPAPPRGLQNGSSWAASWSVPAPAMAGSGALVSFLAMSAVAQRRLGPTSSATISTLEWRASSGCRG